jgi:hypothetical protein
MKEIKYIIRYISGSCFHGSALSWDAGSEHKRGLHKKILKCVLLTFFYTSKEHLGTK